MTGETHKLVANLALATLDVKKRYILYPRWGGIESGAVLSDEFRIMWEFEEVKSNKRQLVHRCYIDSEDVKDHGCVTRALDYAEGSISFIKDYLTGDIDTYTEDEFLENLGMFLGIVSHHICDLCTPLHVGHHIDFNALGFKTMNRFHKKVERDIEKFSWDAKIRLNRPKTVRLSKKYFWDIATTTYNEYFCHLESTYQQHDYSKISEMAAGIISLGVKHTRNVWHTILEKTRMTDRKWSLQPLL